MQSSTTFISRAIKRVLRDLDEIQRDPIPGLSLCMPDKNDPFTLHGNIEVKDGIYEGILLHLVFHIPEEYPIKPPAVNISPGLDFGYKYHAHVYDNSIHGNSICTDLTSNFAGHFSNIDAHGKPTKSGWTPAYTLSSVLMQLQVFFADPDKPKDTLPSEEKIKKLKDHISKYKFDIRTYDEENGVQIVTHSFDKPYPPLSSIPPASIIEIISDEKEICEDKVEREPQLKAVSVKKEEIDISRSTAYSVTRNQSNSSSNDNQSSNSSSSERKQELLEELKEEEEVKVDIVSDKKVTGSIMNQNRPLDEHRSNFSSSNSISEIEETKTLEPQQINSWGKPLKKVSKEEAGKNSKTTKTVVVTVQKPLPPSEPEIEVWPLRSQEKPKAAPRVSNKEKNETDEQRAFRRAEKISVNSSMSHKVEETKVPEPQQSATGWRTSLINRASQPTTQTTDAPIRRFYNSQRDKTELVDVGLQLRQELKVENDPFFIKDNIYKQTIAQNKMTAPQIINDISNKLVCSVTKTDVFDSSKPILGYPIDLEKDHQGRLWPTPIMELLSYDAFVFNIQQNFDKLDNYHQVKFTSSFGSKYNYWLPVYVDEAHFERGKQYIFNAIAIIYSGVEGKKENDFHPLMVLKVLPPILVKTAIHFIMGTIHQSVAGIDAYCQLYRLFVKLVEMFPELQEAIDNEVKNFCKSDANRHKKIAGDLGDFFVKLTLFSKGSNNKEAINHVFNEHFTRQVYWAGKADGGLAFREYNCPNFLQRFMLATQVSNKFFLTKLEIARLLLDEDVKTDLEKRCGLLNDETMKLFRERLGWIQKNIAGDWKVFVVAAGQESFVYSEQTMFACAKKAFEAAKSKGYMT